MNNQELLPCPFCGGDEKIDEFSDVVNFNKKSYRVECKKCGVYIHFDSKDQAIEAWNTRVNKEKKV